MVEEDLIDFDPVRDRQNPTKGAACFQLMLCFVDMGVFRSGMNRLLLLAVRHNSDDRSNDVAQVFPYFRLRLRDEPGAVLQTTNECECNLSWI